MNRNSHLSTIVILSFLCAGYAQADQSVLGSARHAVGFRAGSASGPGLTYRLYTPRSYYQGSFFARANRRNKLSDLILGVSWGHILSELSIVKALPPTALVFVTGIDGRFSNNEPVENSSTGQTIDEAAVNTGLGIALEIGNTFSPGLQFSVGTTYTLSIEKQTADWQWSLGPQVAFGLLYNW